MTITVYGIPNCDTVRKARKWLDQAGIAYVFHDYKKQGAEPARLRGWAQQVGWYKLLNQRGTTFRRLPDEERADLNESRAIAIMAAHTSTIRRPVVEYPGGLLVGFAEDQWQAAFSGK